MKTNLRNLSAWFLLIWLISLCGALGQNILLNTIALYVGAGTAGLLSLSYAGFAVAGRLAAGALADRRSRRLVLFLGCVLFAVSTLLFGATGALPALFLLRGLHGAGFSLINTAASAASVDVAPPDAANRSLGLFWISLALAGAVSAYIGLALTAGGSFSLLFVVTAGILTVGAVLSLFCRYEQKRPPRNRQSAPLRIIEPAALPAGILLFLVSMALSSVNNFALALADARGYTLGGLFFLLGSAVMVVANSSAARLGERWGLPRTMCCVCIPFAGAALLAGWVDSQAVYLLLAAAYGACSGVANPTLNYAAIRTLPREKRGAGSSTLFLFQDLGYGLGAMVCGWTASEMGYHLMYTMAALFALAVLPACARFAAQKRV